MFLSAEVGSIFATSHLTDPKMELSSIPRGDPTGVGLHARAPRPVHVPLRRDLPEHARIRVPQCPPWRQPRWAFALLASIHHCNTALTPSSSTVTPPPRTGTAFIARCRPTRVTTLGALLRILVIPVDHEEIVLHGCCGLGFTGSGKTRQLSCRYIEACLMVVDTSQTYL